MTTKIKICRVPNCKNNTRNNRTLCCKHATRWHKYKSFDLPIGRYERVPQISQKDLPEGIKKRCILHGNLTADLVIENGFGKEKRRYCFFCKKEHSKKATVKKYGLNVSQYNEMIKIQNNLCKICNKSETIIDIRNNTIKDLTIDHCHKTGKIRGLLCSKCNKGLGLFYEDPILFEIALNYLKSNM